MAQLTAEVSNLREELLTYTTTVAPLIEETLFVIREEKFDADYAGILSLRKLLLYDFITIDDFINAATAMFKPIPSLEYNRNLAE